MTNKSNNERYEKEEHMRQEQKLMVGIDQITLKIYCNTSSSWKTMAKQVIDIFVEKAEFREIHWIESQETHGCSRGYTKAMYICANIGCKVLVEWNHVKADLGIRIHFSAHAWAEYQYAFWSKNVEMDFLTFFKRIQCEKYEVTSNRIDLTADYQNYPKGVHPDSINRRIREGALCVKDSSGRASYRKEPTTIWNGNSCNTITLGSYRGNIGHYMRIYDKKEEAISNNSFRAKEASKCKNWVRFEVVFLRQEAKDLVERMLREVSSVDDLPAFLASRILHYYNFVQMPEMEDTIYTKDLKKIRENHQFGFLRKERPKDQTLEKKLKYIKQKSGLYELVSLIDEVAEASGESPYDIHRQIFKILCIDSWRYRNDDAPLKKDYKTKKKRIIAAENMESIKETLREIFGEDIL